MGNNKNKNTKLSVQRFFAVIFIMLTSFAGIAFLGRLTEPVNNQDAFSTIDAFHELPDNSLDIITFGSSHMWKGLNAVKMQETCGKKVYNYGANWQRINTTNLFIRDAFRTQMPKLVIIDTFFACEILENTDMNGELQYTRRITGLPYKLRYLKQCFGTDPERWLSYYMPLCAYHDRWKQIEEISFTRPLQTELFRKNQGYCRVDDINPVEYDDHRWKQDSFVESSVNELDNIVEICSVHGAKVLFVTIPLAYNFAFSDAMREFARSHDCVYVDLNDYRGEIGLDPESDFTDEDHLNVSGAEKVGIFLDNMK